MTIIMAAVIYFVGNYQSGQRPDLSLGPSVTASWYKHGHTMANGQPFDKNNKYRAAHPKWRFGTKVLVTDTETGNWLVVEITDRGPFTDCGLDLTEAGARHFGYLDQGRKRLHVKVIYVPPK